jgi:predicted nucleic acid-binding protein
MILVDTNLLCRLANRAHAHHPAARQSLQKLRTRGETLAIMPQNIYEFWSTATRPAGVPPLGSNGLGLSVTIVDKWLDYLQKRFFLLEESDQILSHWRGLVRAHGVTGSRCHDARLAAAMEVHGIREILTFNGADFRRYSFVSVIDPQRV